MAHPSAFGTGGFSIKHILYLIQTPSFAQPHKPFNKILQPENEKIIIVIHNASPIDAKNLVIYFFPLFPSSLRLSE